MGMKNATTAMHCGTKAICRFLAKTRLFSFFLIREMQPPILRNLAQTVIVRTLVCKSEDCIQRRLLIELLRSTEGNCLSEDVLILIIEKFPQQLTDELLFLLAPKHIRHINLKGCSFVTCDGLIKTIERCSHIHQLDFTGCNSLLRPSVFCCLKDFAPKITTLLFEDCEVLTDDCVQIILMCCPKLEQLNISSCKNITDKAFALKPSSHKNKLSQRAQQAGRHLASVDISGCQTLTSVAIRNLVDLCGNSLKSINIAWTGVGCIALLYLSGLSLQGVKQFVEQADSSCVRLLETDSKQECDESTTNVDTSSDPVNDNLQCTNNNKETYQVFQHGEETQQNCKNDSRHFELPLDINPVRDDKDNDEHCIVYKEYSVSDIFKDDSQRQTDDIGDNNKVDSYLATELYSSKCSASSPGGSGLKSNGDQEKDSLSCKVEQYDNHPIEGNFMERESVSNISDEYTITNQTVSTQDRYSLDDEWLSWQQIDQLCSDNGGLYDHIWSDVSEDSVSSAFKDGIACLTSAFINLESLDDDNDDDDYNDDGDSDKNSCIQANPTLSLLTDSQDNTNGKSDFSSCDEEDHILDEADKHLADIFSVDEVYSDNLSSPLHDAVISLTAAMGDLINDDSDDDEDECVNDDDKNQLVIMDSTHDKTDEEPGSLCCHGNADFSGFHGNKPSINQNEEVGSDCVDLKVDSLDPISTEQINLVMFTEEKDSSLNKGDGNKEHQADTVKSSVNCIQTPENSHRQSIVKSSFHTGTIPLKLTHNPQLHSIDISSIYFHSKALGVACLKMFMNMNKSLKSFTTSWTELDDDTLISFLKSVPELCSLTLIDCEKITDKSLKVLPVYCPQLKKIDLKGVPFITDGGVVPMLSSPSLQSLSLAEASITDITMFAITEQCGDKLHDLDLSWCEDLTDKGMSAMVTSCTSLQSLALRQCAASFVTIEMLSCCHGMTSLNIAGIDQFTDQMLTTLATNLPNLVSIDVSWNSSLTSVGVCALMSNCCHLQEANLSGLKALTSKPFLHIISDLFMWRSKQEVMLRRKFKSQLHGGSAETFLKPCSMEIAKHLGDDLPFRSTTYCPVLRSLVLEYSDKVNDDHMAQIVAVCRGTLTVTDYYSQLIEPKWIFFDWTKKPFKEAQ